MTQKPLHYETPAEMFFLLVVKAYVYQMSSAEGPLELLALCSSKLLSLLQVVVTAEQNLPSAMA